MRCSVVGQRWTVALVAGYQLLGVDKYLPQPRRPTSQRSTRAPATSRRSTPHLHGRTRFFPNSSEFALFNPNENFVDSESAPFQRLSLSIGRFSGACTENASPGLTVKKTIRIAKTVVALVQAVRYRGSATRSHRSISASGAFEQLRCPCRGM